MAILLDLCVELLQEIGNELTMTADRACLRAVCKALARVMNPLFFSSFFLRSMHLRSKKGIHMLRALATGQTGWSAYAKTLWIRPGVLKLRGLMRGPDDSEEEQLEGDEENFDLSDTGMQELLSSALRSMMKIRTVSIQILHPDGSDPKWLLKPICDFLTTLPSLDILQIDVYADIELSLPRLSGVSVLNIRTAVSPWDNPNVYGVLPIVLQSSTLTGLHLSGSRTWSEVWATLHTDTNLHIHLQDISVNTVTLDLLTYLASYSGLETLALERPDGDNTRREKCDNLADVFFNTVLPRHASSLIYLSCPATYECDWSIGTHNIDAISGLHRLQMLEISINSTDLCNTVDLLLRTVAELLPAVRDIAMFHACDWELRNGGMLLASITRNLRYMAYDSIIAAVLNFNLRSSVPVCATTVLVGSTWFKRVAEPVEETEQEEGGNLGNGQLLFKYRQVDK
ncbi:hypothetical protein B0H11DRAFT_1007056 [Mycena galericulata]|nr:hypothetical protein B0H11DRAFT_1007056 [Mycena galericulata]